MLNRALTISIIAIFFLLGIQGVWLYRLIDSEKDDYRNKAETILKEAVNKELNSRMKRISESDGFSVIISDNIPDGDKHNSNNIENIGTVRNQFTKVSIEAALQDAYKNDLPLDIDTLSGYFATLLKEEGKETNFKLTYLDSATSKTYSTENKSVFKNVLIKSSFETSFPISISKDLIVSAHILYPPTVFKGDLLIMLISSLVLTIFIMVSIVLQTRMLYKQVSLAKVKENITHFLTHELRSPLQSSITNLEVAEMADSKTAPYFLGKSKEQLYFLNGLIENILDINKFEKRQAPLKKKLFNINEAIDPHIARHNVDPKKSIEITKQIPDGGEEIYGDELHISNAIGNLIDNAIKYSDDSVKINVSTRKEGKYFYISVEDNGIGIPKEEQAKVFEKFYRGSKKEHAQKGKGFGLGLNYVMWVVRAHKGKITLVSEVGKGSTFTLSINCEHGKEDTSGR
ncbi:MAG: HAMP domain-containing histidine kinase [Bacteroidales bacterium]|nr:HAMP domain-containing histidine kinase [Bacteroidales bacterium]